MRKGCLNLTLKPILTKTSLKILHCSCEGAQNSTEQTFKFFFWYYKRQEGNEREEARNRCLPVRQSKSDSKMG